MKNLYGVALLPMLALPALAQDSDVVEAARVTLAGIQSNSFDADREYCGMIGRDARGEVVTTRPNKGRRDSCLPRSFEDDAVEVVASYHTHGSYDFDADAEVPSSDDFDADLDEGVIGFVATPGGRFWMIEPEEDRVTQLCGIGCLPKDADFEPGMAGDIPTHFTRFDLLQREQGLDGSEPHSHKPLGIDE